MTSASTLWLYALYAITVWWASTGIIIWLMGRAERTFRWSMLAAVLTAMGAIVVVIVTRDVTTPAGAIAAFSASIVVWGLIEMAFLMGYVVGWRRERCPDGVEGWERFKLSFLALAHHEFALVAAAGGLFWLTFGAANQVAFWAFALLWSMRLSTKLNIFMGVANIAEEILPARISHLNSYFRKAPMNALFPFSITASTILVVLLVQQAITPASNEFEAAAGVLLATFAAIAVLEHWMLVTPIPSEALWPWSASTAGDRPDTAGAELGSEIASPGRAMERGSDNSKKPAADRWAGRERAMTPTAMTAGATIE